MWSALQKIDVYPKTLADFKVKTLGGGIVTIASGIVILILFVSEFMSYLSPQTQMELTVDNQMSKRLGIDFSVEFPLLGCSVISLDAMDISGEQQNELHHDVTKRRMPKDCTFLVAPGGGRCAVQSGGADMHSKHKVNEAPVNVTAVAEVTKPGYCGSCYGAAEPGKCCNTCDEVREAYRRKSWSFKGDVEQCEKDNVERKLQEEKHEGCTIHGHINVQRVAGNFHFAPGKSFQHAQFHVHDFMSLGDASKYNMTHKINYLGFGQREKETQNHPLDGEVRIAPSPGMFQYYVKVVPTEHRVNGEVRRSNHYSYTEHFKAASPHAAGRTLPGVFFIYDISPILVIYNDSGKSFLHFITQLCAVIGGVFTVAGMADQVIYKGQRMLEKQAVGKLG